MTKPRLVKRDEIDRRKTKPAPAKSKLTQINQAVQERKQLSSAARANARVAFAALFTV